MARRAPVGTMAVMSSIWTIRRSTSDAKLAGVCGGVARHWNVDPLLVRVGCVLLALSGGIGLVLYVAGWLLIPAEGSERPVIHDLLGEQASRLSREIWIAIVVIACNISFAVLGSVTPFGIGPALILARIWYFGYYRTKVRKTPSPPPAAPAPAMPPAQPTQFYSYSGPPTAFTQAADAWRERIVQVQRDSAAQRTTSSPNTPPSTYPAAGAAWSVDEDRSEPSGWVTPPSADDPAGSAAVAEQQAYLAHPDPVGLYSPEPAVTAVVPAVPKPADRRSARRLRLVAVLMLGLTLTGLAIADAAGASVSAVTYLAAALLVLGLTLIAATWLGRARGILPIGLLLAVITMGVAAAPQLPPATEWQSQQIAYTDVAALPAAGDHRDVGNLSVDLSRLALTDDATYTADIDLGELSVTVPEKVNVVVDYTVDAGAVTAFGTKAASGTELHAVLPPTAPDPKQPTLTLKLSADVGQIEVTR
jgi:phage shock protein PspC (stress-responsive transcriptional regulator)